MANLCRTCLNDSISLHCYDISHNIVDNEHLINISKLIKMFTEEDINENDVLPKRICSDCYSYLLNAFKFKLRCEASLKYLKHLIQSDHKVECESSDEDLNKLEKTNSNYMDVTLEYIEQSGGSEKEEVVKVKAKKRKGIPKHGIPKVKVEKNLVCYICDKRYAQSTYLEAHMVKHKEKYFCELCKKYYKDEKIHKKVNHSSSKFTCNECNRTFVTRSRLAAHLVRHQNIESRPMHKCSIEGCSKSFMSLSGIKRHELIHSGSRPYMCEICSKTFIDKLGLQIHSQTHDPNSTYSCRHCDAKLKSRNSRDSHEKLKHTGIKKNQCSICNMKFILKYQLKRHLYTHSKDNKIQCSYCTKQFSRSDYKKQHELKSHGLSTEIKTQDLGGKLNCIGIW